MSVKSNTYGRSYEFACLITLYEEIGKVKKVRIEENSSYFVCYNSFRSLKVDEKASYKISAKAAVKTLFQLEPLILDDGDDELLIKIQSDDKGESGDVRDVLIIRSGIKWEIGISVKHNHFAVKHSRLSSKLDFGKKWYNINCSSTYWQDIKPIFDYLSIEKAKGTLWRDLDHKEDEIYKPLLEAFKKEINYQYKVHREKIPKSMVEYLLGRFDFYKVIGIDNQKITQVQSFNLRGTLNQQGKIRKSTIEVPKVTLPTRIISFDFKPNSKNTLELYLDGGWQFSFRIHNAATKVENSLKFDIKIIGMPTTIMTINCSWI